MVQYRGRTSTFFNPGVIGGLGHDKLGYTPGQVGAAARPNPGPPGSWVGSNAVPDPRRAAYPDAGGADGVRYLPRDARSYRGRGRGGVATVVVGGPGSLDATSGAPGQRHGTVAAHTMPGSWVGSNAVPDPRRQWYAPGVDRAGLPLPQDDMMYPAQGRELNLQIVAGAGPGVLENVQEPPDPVRAGVTGRDNYRWGRRWVATFNRPYDKWAVEHDGDKHAMPDPLPSTPLAYAQDIPNAVPSPGGRWAAVGQQGVGLDRSTVKINPRPWGEDIVDAGTGVGAAAVGTARRNRGWR